jgi:Na+-transporting NADH:ubiquinone oxidoreductase subunit B
LFGNIFAPLIDHFVVMANIKRRSRVNVWFKKSFTDFKI